MILAHAKAGGEGAGVNVYGGAEGAGVLYRKQGKQDLNK